MADGRTVAVIGASSDRRKFGNKAVRAFLRQGFDVVPINPHESTVEGLPCYRSVLDVPRDVELATMYVRPDVGMALIEELARKGIRKVWLNPGADHPRVVARARELGVEPMVACSIIAIGENPAAL